MQAFHGIAGRINEIFERNGERFRRRFGRVKSEQHIAPLFSIQYFNDTSYYPLRSLLRDDAAGLVALLDGYLWHDRVKDTTNDLESKVMELCNRVLKGDFVPEPAFSGIYNLIVFDRSNSTLFLTSDSSNLFPLYYALQKDGLAFASHLHVLARALSSSLDDLGVLETVTLDYTLGERTLYEGVRRLLPGQTIVYDLRDQSLRQIDHQELFQEISSEENASRQSEQVWQTFVQACKRVGQGREPVGVMLSGGLDSRLVVAGLQAAKVSNLTCTHGEVGYHEVKVAREVADIAGTPHHLIPMEGNAYIGSCGELEDVFWRSDSTLFPVWRLGGQLLKDRGAHAVTTGYALDATLGGHFHDPRALRRRLFRRLRHAVQKPQSSLFGEFSGVEYLNQYADQFQVQARKQLREQRQLLHPDYYRRLFELEDRFTEDLDAEFERIRRTGTKNAAKIVERFLCENHARKYSFSQELAVRSFLPVVVPSFDRNLIKLLSNMNPILTVDHYLYFKLMRRFTPEYARVAWSSTVLPISYPTILLELSRLARNRYDKYSKQNFIRSKGNESRASRFGPMNYEKAARQPGNLEGLEAALVVNGKSHVLDGEAIGHYIDRIRRYECKSLNLTRLTNLVTVKFAEVLN